MIEMVRIEYVDGTEDTVETIGMFLFKYDSGTQCFIVNDQLHERDCMMIPREFVKSIRHIEV